jgi:PAS domain S-box-containing protein
MTAPQPPGSNITLLLVEDDQESLSLYCTKIAAAYPGMAIHTAGNGRAGVEAFESHGADIVLADLRMPVMDGIEMGRHIRKLDPGAIIVALTAYTDTHYMLQAIEIGIHRYVLKQMEDTSLIETIDDCLAQIALQKRLAEQHLFIRKLSRAVEQSPSTVVITDAEGAIEFVNPKFTEMTGYPAEEALGKTPRLLKSGRMAQEIYRQLWSTIEAGHEWRGELLNRKKNGDLRWHMVSISPLVDERGLITNFVAVMEDITEHKGLVEELKDANQDLEAFGYSISHDLRKPLTIISGYAEVLMSCCSDALGENNRYLENIRRGSEQMSEMIETLLRFSRLAHGEVRRETVDLSQLVQEVAEGLRSTSPGRRAVFRIAEGLSAHGDAPLLRIALENLLGNAWKYTSHLGEALIEVGCTPGLENPVFFVRDNGIGFDMALAGSIFAPHHRLQEAREFSGQGIGLATVDRIISRHGGRIWAEGKPGRGATFFFTLGETEDGSLPVSGTEGGGGT